MRRVDCKASSRILKFIQRLIIRAVSLCDQDGVKAALPVLPGEHRSLYFHFKSDFR